MSGTVSRGREVGQRDGEAWPGVLGAAVGIGALAGLLPAVRAARLTPTQALWTR